MNWHRCSQIVWSFLLAGTLSAAEANPVTPTAETRAEPAGRILFVLSGHRFHGDSNLPASVSFGEVVHAWDTFDKAGFAVDFVSPLGGAVPVDPSRLSPKLAERLTDNRIMAGLTATQKPAQINAALYQAVYYVGGSNAMYQVPDDAALQQISRHIYEQNNGVVSAVCHGTAGIARIKLSNGQYLVAGKRVTGYPEEYEDQQADYFRHLPFAMRKTLEAHGGIFKAPDPEQAYIEVDGRLVTGQNYPSAPLVAAAVVQLLQQPTATAVAGAGPARSVTVKP